MAFNQAAVKSLINQLQSIAMQQGVFRSVNTHEPKAAPGTGYRCAIWVQNIEPVGLASGLASTSGYLVCNARIYGNMLSKPEDDIDPRMTYAASTLIGAYSADYTLSGTIRNIDLLGAYGQKLSAVAGYLTIDSHMYRIMTLTIPCIVDDMWTQVST
jgi:hypothetical protein